MSKTENKSIEKYLEKRFCTWCNEHSTDDHKIIPIKGWAQQYTGIPDRIVILPYGHGTLWIEFKGGTAYGLTAMQQKWRKWLIDSDPNRYYCIDTKEDLEHLLNLIERCLTVKK